MHKINLWESHFSDNSYFGWVENPDIYSPNVSFELETFVEPVIQS